MPEYIKQNYIYPHRNFQQLDNFDSTLQDVYNHWNISNIKHVFWLAVSLKINAILFVNLTYRQERANSIFLWFQDTISKNHSNEFVVEIHHCINMHKEKKNHWNVCWHNGIYILTHFNHNMEAQIIFNFVYIYWLIYSCFRTLIINNHSYYWNRFK